MAWRGMSQDEEIRLAGGNLGGAVRVGDTVRRPVGPWTPAVHALLGHLAGRVPMLAGGLSYTAGAISYHRRWPDPYPSVFGYHEVFHACVCAAATCQFAAIALLPR